MAGMSWMLAMPVMAGLALVPAELPSAAEPAACETAVDSRDFGAVTRAGILGKLLF